MELLCVSLAYFLLGLSMVTRMGEGSDTEKVHLIPWKDSELRLIRAAIRFSQLSRERPLTFRQDVAASNIGRRITVQLGEPLDG